MTTKGLTPILEHWINAYDFEEYTFANEQVYKRWFWVEKFGWRGIWMSNPGGWTQTTELIPLDAKLQRHHARVRPL